MLPLELLLEQPLELTTGMPPPLPLQQLLLQRPLELALELSLELHLELARRLPLELRAKPSLGLFREVFLQPAPLVHLLQTQEQARRLPLDLHLKRCTLVMLLNPSQVALPLLPATSLVLAIQLMLGLPSKRVLPLLVVAKHRRIGHQPQLDALLRQLPLKAARAQARKLLVMRVVLQLVVVLSLAVDPRWPQGAAPS